MSFDNEIQQPSVKELRNFGVIMGVVILLLFGIITPWLFGSENYYWAWLLSGIFISWSFIKPAGLDVTYRLWMKFGLIMNSITTPVILGILYYFIITPIGIMMRSFGRDVMGRQFDKNINTYRIKSEQRTRESMERPF